MTKAEKVPVLRFPEFQGEWQTKNLGAIARFSKGKGISKADITPDGTLECIRYGELYTHYGELIVETVSRTNVNESDLVLSQANDVIIPASGETQIDIAKASCVLRSGIALGGDLNILRVQEDGVFISYYLNSRKKHDIAALAQGISVVHLYASQLSLLNLNLPSLPEQQKIASFLTAVDEKIRQLTRKKALLEQYKKGVMQKIFSREIRFKPDGGGEYPEWEEKMLGEVGEVKMCRRVFNEETSAVGEIPFYKIGSFGKVADAFISSELYLEYRNKYPFPKVGTVLISAAGTIGRLVVYNGEDAYYQDSNIVWIDNDNSIVCNEFLFYVLQTVKYNTEGGTIQQLYNNILKSTKFNAPCLPEQKRIANFLSAIDKKLNQISNLLHQAQQWRKGLLQGVFV